MRVCKHLLKRVSEFLDSTNESAVICEQVTTINESEQPIPMVLLCSEFYIRLLAYETAFEQPKLVVHRMWLDIVSISLTKERLEISFTRDLIVILEGPNVIQLCEAIKSHLLTFMHQNELPEFILSVPIRAKGQFSPLLQMFAQYLALGGHLTPECCNKARTFFNSDPDTLILSDFAYMGQRIGPLFRIIPSFPSIKQLVIDIELTEHVRTPLQKLVAEPGNVNYLVFSGPISCPIDDVVKNMSETILRVKFTRVELGVNGVKAVISLFKAKKVKDITISGCISQANEQLFVDEGKGAFEVDSLRLMHNPEMDVTKIIPLMRKIFNLRVYNCDLQIGKLFSVLRDIDIVQLDLSNTHFSEPLPDFEWPEHLKIVRFDRCAWGFEAFLKAFEKCVSKRMSVAFGHASFRTPNWNLFNEVLQKIESSNIIGLEWDENPLDLEMLKFLKRCSGLRELSINGCTLGIGCASALADVISSATSLNIFKFNATDPSNEMGPSDALEIINSIRRNKSLKEIEIQGQLLGNHNMNLLTYTLLENTHISKFLYDFAGITDMKQFLAFTNELSFRGVPLEMNWPRKLIEKAIDGHEITEDEAAQARFNFSLMKKGKKRARKSEVVFESPPELPRSRAEQRAAAHARTRTRSAMDQPVHMVVVKHTEETEPPTSMRQFVPHFRKVKLDGRKRLFSMAVHDDAGQLSPREDDTIALTKLSNKREDADEELRILRLSSSLLKLVSEEVPDEEF